MFIIRLLLSLSVVTAFLAVGITALPPGITISQLDFGTHTPISKPVDKAEEREPASSESFANAVYCSWP